MPTRGIYSDVTLPKVGERQLPPLSALYTSALYTTFCSLYLAGGSRRCIIQAPIAQSTMPLAHGRKNMQLHVTTAYDFVQVCLE